ncbi:hypothetical protein D9M68_936050 [compost metagenome]
MRSKPCQGLAVESQCPGRNAWATEDAGHQCGLTGAVRADQGHDFTFGDVQVDATQCVHVPVVNMDLA